MHPAIDSSGRTPRRSSEPCLVEPVILPFPVADPQPASETALVSSRPPTFLEELEMRQDEVLEQLDELDRRIVTLIEEVVHSRDVAAA
jgi:hypothetical protein